MSFSKSLKEAVLELSVQVIHVECIIPVLRLLIMKQNPKNQSKAVQDTKSYGIIRSESE